jgi:hypothetical protein
MEMAIWLHKSDKAKLVCYTLGLVVFIATAFAQVGAVRTVWYDAWLLGYHDLAMHTACQVLKISKNMLHMHQQRGGMILNSWCKGNILLLGWIEQLSWLLTDHSSQLADGDEAKISWALPFRCHNSGVPMQRPVTGRVHLYDDCIAGNILLVLQEVERPSAETTVGMMFLCSADTNATSQNFAQAGVYWCLGSFLPLGVRVYPMDAQCRNMMIKMAARTVCHSHCCGQAIQLLYIVCGILAALLDDRLGDKPVFKGGGMSCPGL